MKWLPLGLYITMYLRTLNVTNDVQTQNGPHHCVTKWSSPLCYQMILTIVLANDPHHNVLFQWNLLWFSPGVLLLCLPSFVRRTGMYTTNKYYTIMDFSDGVCDAPEKILAHQIQISQILPWDKKSYLTHFSHIPMHTRSSDPYVSSLLEKSVPHGYPCEISITNTR